MNETRAGEPGDFPTWELRDWADLGIVAGVSAAGPDTSLGLWGGEPVDRVEGRWAKLMERWPGGFDGVAISRQIHGKSVGEVESVSGLTVFPDRDGHVTSRTGVLLTVTVADCVPVYLAHPQTKTVGLLHSGWKGTASGILAEGVQALQNASGCTAGDVIMHCGVSICGSCYEVDSDVAYEITGVRHKGKVCVDLRSVLAAQAAKIGLKSVTLSSRCTAHQRGSFFSHRGSGGKMERMAAFIGVGGST